MFILFCWQQFTICLNDVSLTPEKGNNEITAQTVLDFAQRAVTPYSMILSDVSEEPTTFILRKEK
jgi:hypothetical protein